MAERNPPDKDSATHRRESQDWSWRTPLSWHGPWWNILGNIEFFIAWLLGIAAWILWGRANEPVLIERVIPLMRNGDLLTFSGLGIPQTLGTKVFTRSDKSHSAVIIILNKQPYVFESNTPTDHVVDVLTGIEGKSGVRIIPVREKIAEYYDTDSSGPITFIPLLTDSGRRPRFALDDWGGVGEDWIRNEHAKSFNSNLFSLIGGDEHAFHSRLFRDIAHPAGSEHKRFCSELVAAYLEKLGVLVRTRDEAMYCPDDFFHAHDLILNAPYIYGQRYDLY